jgi:NitT/TauT family transport system permease protein
VSGGTPDAVPDAATGGGMARTARVAAAETAASRRRWAIIVLRIAVGAGFIGLWQHASGNWIETLLVSSPAAVAARLWQWTLDGTLWDNLSVTLYATAWGFAIGGAIGFSLGLLFGRYTLLADVFGPYITAIYSIPLIALAPLYIIWFGIGIASKVAVSATIVFFVIFLNTFSGVREVNPLYLNVTRIMGGREIDVLRHVIVPSAASWVITGLKVSVPYALVGTVIGEFMSSNLGIGFLISQATGLFDTTGVYAGIIILGVVGAVINIGLKHIESYVLRWQGQ